MDGKNPLPEDYLGGTVRNLAPSLHNHFQHMCTGTVRRSVHIRMDVGDMKMLYSATLTHVGYEFDQVPLIDLILDDGNFDTSMVLTSCNVTPTVLSLHYRAKDLVSKFAGNVVDMRQVVIRLCGNDKGPQIKAGEMIKDWMKGASSLTKRREALPFELDEYPVVSVLRVIPSTRQGRFKNVQRPVAKIVSEVIHNGCIYLQFGTTYERIFRDTIGDYIMVKYMCERNADLTHKKAKDVLADEEGLLRDFSSEGPLVVENPSSLMVLGEVRAPETPSCYGLKAGIVLTMGMTLEDWYHYDHLTEVIEHLGDSRPYEETQPPPVTWRRNASRAANE